MYVYIYAPFFGFEVKVVSGLISALTLVWELIKYLFCLEMCANCERFQLLSLVEYFEDNNLVQPCLNTLPPPPPSPYRISVSYTQGTNLPHIGQITAGAHAYSTFIFRAVSYSVHYARHICHLFVGFVSRGAINHFRQKRCLIYYSFFY